MNMKQYQEFQKILITQEEYEEKGWADLQIKTKITQNKETYTKLHNTEDMDKIFLLEKSDWRRKLRNLRLFLNEAHIFELENKYKWLILLTNTPHIKEKLLWQQVRLPFSQIFLDIEFDEGEIEGFDGKITGIMIREMKNIITLGNTNLREINYDVIYGLVCSVAGVTKEGNIFLDTYEFPMYSETNNTNEIFSKTIYTEDNYKIKKFIQNFIINFCLFLKDREVNFIERKRNDKGNERRIKNGKLPLPSSKVINVFGDLKRYIDTIDDNSFKGKLSYRFWVCGHWRTYRSEKWKSMQGKIIWIAPFMKGQGVLIKNSYRVIPEETDDVLDYEEIK